MKETTNAPRVLVVDDSATDRVLSKSLLTRDGFEVMLAVDGFEALQSVEQVRPDIVLTDLRMPRVDGLELVQQMRGKHAGIPVILMTAYGSEEIAAAALQAGAASYVPKDDLVQELSMVVKHVLSTLCKPNERPSQATTDAEFEYELGYDPDGVGELVTRLQERLPWARLEDESEVVRVGIALAEALNNAVEHGNLELLSDWREDYAEYEKIRASRAQQSPYSDRRVRVTQRISSDTATFVISDEGKGFDPSGLPDPTDPENLMNLSGRGMLLIRTFMDEVRFNEKGNEITMVKKLTSL